MHGNVKKCKETIYIKNESVAYEVSVRLFILFFLNSFDILFCEMKFDFKLYLLLSLWSFNPVTTNKIFFFD